MNLFHSDLDVHIAGFGVETGLGSDHASLIQAIENGETAARREFFGNSFEASMAGFSFNPQVIPSSRSVKKFKGYFEKIQAAEMARFTLKVMTDALASASIPIESLENKRTCVFFGGPGVQPETASFLPFIRRNDKSDVALNRGIRNLTFESHDQDEFTHLIRNALNLREPPISVYSASCSSFAAAYLAYCSLRSRACDLAIVVSFQHVSLFDLMFMNDFGGVAAGKSGPFCANSEGTILGDGVCAMVLESTDHLSARKGAPYAVMDSMVMRQSAGTVSRATTFKTDFRVIDRTVLKAMEDANRVSAHDISCIFPHGNGIRSSDRSEALALQKTWGTLPTPVVSYKAQMGYPMASSALIDMAIMCSFLETGLLPSFKCDGAVDTDLGIRIHANDSATPLCGNIGVKIGLGIEGSVGVVVIRSLRSRSQS